MNTDTAITHPQIKKLHCLYRELKIDSKGLINGFTKGRTDSTAGLTKTEAIALIGKLTGINTGQRHRRIIFSLAYQIGIIFGHTELDLILNRVKLNLFLKEKGAVKKPIETMTVPELIKTHRQFKKIAENVDKANDNKAAQRATDRLLVELDIAVLSK